jgi:hypothetical protein
MEGAEPMSLHECTRTESGKEVLRGFSVVRCALSDKELAERLLEPTVGSSRLHVPISLSQPREIQLNVVEGDGVALWDRFDRYLVTEDLLRDPDGLSFESQSTPFEETHVGLHIESIARVQTAACRCRPGETSPTRHTPGTPARDG